MQTAPTFQAFIASSADVDPAVLAGLKEACWDLTVAALEDIEARFPSEELYHACEVVDPRKIGVYKNDTEAADQAINTIFDRFPHWGEHVTRVQAKQAFAFYCSSPAVQDAYRLHPKCTDVHEFYDTLLGSDDLLQWCKFSALVLHLPTGNAISESGFSMVTFCKNKFRNSLRTTLLDAQLLAHANGPSIPDFARLCAMELAKRQR